MKIHWQQLSPGERETLIRHFLLNDKRNVPVTTEEICAALQKTHSLSCYSKEGRLVFEFVTTENSSRSGASLAEDFSEGIYKAALRAKGVEVDDGLSMAVGPRELNGEGVRLR